MIRPEADLAAAIAVGLARRWCFPCVTRGRHVSPIPRRQFANLDAALKYFHRRLLALPSQNFGPPPKFTTSPLENLISPAPTIYGDVLASSGRVIKTVCASFT